MSLNILANLGSKRLNEIDERCNERIYLLEKSYGMKYLLLGDINENQMVTGYAECAIEIDGYYESICLVFDIINDYNLVSHYISTAKLLPKPRFYLSKRVWITDQPTHWVKAREIHNFT